MSDRTIRDAINQITGNHLADRVYVAEATVTSVNISARTCVCEMVQGKSTGSLNDVRLMATADDGLLIIPSIGSNVCIILSDFTPPYISQYSAVDKIIFRGGDLGGMVEVVKLTAKLNGLVTQLNAELIKIQTGLSGVGGVYVPKPTSNFIKSDYENLNITQG